MTTRPHERRGDDRGGRVWRSLLAVLAALAVTGAAAAPALPQGEGAGDRGAAPAADLAAPDESAPATSPERPAADGAGDTGEPAKPGVLDSTLEFVEEPPRRAWNTVRKIWSYEIVATGATPVTVGMIVGALVLFAFGYVAARFISMLLQRRVFPRLGLERAAAATFQRLTFYLLLTVFGIFAMQWAKIPLTVFTVAGGALAIGIGFGSQNIVNNFISGLILMAEQPIKVGDLVEVAGMQGTVEQIGARSTRVHSGDNTHVILPNSMFLEQTVHNLTLDDRRLRTTIDVGVAYGSPTEKASELIRRTIDDDPGVLPKPEPEVLFVDFGDSALMFRAYFWIEVQAPLDSFRVRSRIRHAIDAIFRDAGITIAFPQRDVHLDTSTPLDVRLHDAGREAPRDS